MTDKRPMYTEEFTREAVRLVTAPGYGVAEAARNLGRHASLLGRWKRAVEQTMNGARLGSGLGALDAEGFLAEMLLCFPVLGVGVFSAASTEEKEGTELSLKAKGVEAHGTEAPQGFVIRSGSRAMKVEVPSCHTYLKELRDALVENSVLQASGDTYMFTQDYLFSSPPSAAGVVLGRSATGRTEWRSRDGKTLKAIQNTEALN